MKELLKLFSEFSKILSMSIMPIMVHSYIYLRFYRFLPAMTKDMPGKYYYVVSATPPGVQKVYIGQIKKPS